MIGCCKNKCEFKPQSVDASCVIYDSRNLPVLGIVKGDDVEKALKHIENVVDELSFRKGNEFVGTSVGSGERIFKGRTENNINEFRTIEGVQGITIDDNGDTLVLTVDKKWFEENYKFDFTVENIGSGVELLRKIENNHFGVKKLQSLDNSVVIESNNLNSVNLTINESWLRDKFIEFSSKL